MIMYELKFFFEFLVDFDIVKKVKSCISKGNLLIVFELVGILVMLIKFWMML